MYADIPFHQDIVRHFIFDNTAIRGEWTLLQQSYQDVLKRHNYPSAIQNILGEFIAAACLLSTTIKFDGTLSIQAKSEGDVSLVIAECTSQQKIRAIAHVANPTPSNRFQDILKDGHMAITITPATGERYQGIVPLEGDSLAACLELYFYQSEQLNTKLWLSANGDRAAGMLLQALPKETATFAAEEDENWNRIIELAKTLSTHEMLNLDHETVLHRLFHEEQVRLFEAKDVNFHCQCSVERTAQALRSLGIDDANKILAKKGFITIDCQFCGHRYRFNKNQVDDIFAPKGPIHH